MTDAPRAGAGARAILTRRLCSRSVQNQRRRLLFALAALAGLLAAFANLGLGLWLSARFGSTPVPPDLQWHGLGGLAWFAILSLVLAPLAETAMFMMLALLFERQIGRWAAVVAAVCMTFAHVPQGSRWAMQIIPLQAATALFAMRTSSLRLPVRFTALAAIHAAHNTVALAALAFQ